MTNETTQSPRASARGWSRALGRNRGARVHGTLDGEDTTDFYNLVLSEVEEPLLRVGPRVLRRQSSRASELLGLNRGTLRKKLRQHNLL